MFCNLLFVFVTWQIRATESHPKNLAWNGGPLHLQCENGPDVWIRSGQHISENVIATKALTFQNDIYVISPRMKHGILATLWLLVRDKHTVELQPYPELRIHDLGDCNAIQNAVDFFLDHLGNIWILDTGVIDTLSSPRCTCPPKVVEVSLLLNRVIKNIEISSLAEPTSLLQNIVVDYGLGGKAFIYVSDASRGSVLVHEVSTGSGWSVPACSPSTGLQIALVKRLAHPVLIVVRLHYPGLLEIDTATLRRKGSPSPVRIFGEQSMPMMILGNGAHHVYLRHMECSDVLSWDSRNAYNASKLEDIHSAGPRLTPTSVAADPLKNVLIVLDSNYAHTPYMMASLSLWLKCTLHSPNLPAKLKTPLSANSVINSKEK